MSGYARAYRGRWEHPLFKNKQEAAVWAWMCDTARWRGHSFQTRFGVVALARGQLLVSERTIAEDFGLGRQQVRRLMDSLEISEMIERNSTHAASRAGTIVTIVNFERYQSDIEVTATEATQDQPKGQPKTNPRPTQDQPTREERKQREEGEEGFSPSDSSARASTSTLPAPDDVGAAFAAYGLLRAEFVPGARALDLTAPRRSSIAARLKEIGGLDGWNDVLAQIRASPFLRGEKSRDGKFVAELDWILKPQNMTKIREGNYDDRSNARSLGPRGGASTPTSAIFAARNRLFPDGPPS